jgi:hypothetical protein
MKTLFLLCSVLLTTQLYAECSNGSCGVPQMRGGFSYPMNYAPAATYYYFAPPQNMSRNSVQTTQAGLRFRLILTNLPPNAEIYLDGKKYEVNEKTTRTFSSDPLEEGAYKYWLEIKFNDGVKEITRQKKLLFYAGDVMTLNFNQIEVVSSVTTTNPTTTTSTQRPNFPVVPPEETRNENIVGTNSANVNPLGTKKATIRFFVPESTIILMNGKKWNSSGKERNYTEELSTSVDTTYQFEFIYVDSKNNQQDIERKIAIRGGETHIVSLFQD